VFVGDVNPGIRSFFTVLFIHPYSSLFHFLVFLSCLDAAERYFTNIMVTRTCVQEDLKYNGDRI